MLRGEIFVFGSNLAGKHGAGGAATARLHYNAVYGNGVGRQGDSYAIPTKDEHLHTLPLNFIEVHVRSFLAYARANPGLRFFVTRIGCGLAGYKDEQIGPMFSQAPTNCMLPKEWIDLR